MLVVVVVPRAVPSFSRLRCCGCGGERATVLVESVRQAWCGSGRKHSLFGDSGDGVLRASFPPLRASLRATMFLQRGGLRVKI